MQKWIEWLSYLHREARTNSMISKPENTKCEIIEFVRAVLYIISWFFSWIFVFCWSSRWFLYFFFLVKIAEETGRTTGEVESKFLNTIEPSAALLAKSITPERIYKNNHLDLTKKRWRWIYFVFCWSSRWFSICLLVVNIF